MVSAVTRMALVAVESFVAATAIGGGVALATGLEGERFPPEWLDGTPFSSYLVPGIILTVAVGGSAAIAAVTVALRRRVGGLASIGASMVLIGQIIGEIILLSQPSEPTAIEVAYLAMATIGILGGVAYHRLPPTRREP